MAKIIVRSFAVAALSLVLSQGAGAQTNPKVAEIAGQPKSFLFVGNSFYPTTTPCIPFS